MPPSLPARGAWIEIYRSRSHSGCGRSRSPHGERGLKYKRKRLQSYPRWSLPARGAWIEIYRSRSHSGCGRKSLPARGAWIEIIFLPPLKNQVQSLPARGAWIEIPSTVYIIAHFRRRSPHGERGLKWSTVRKMCGGIRRSPHGERGLKYLAYIIPRIRLFGRSPHGERGLKFFDSGADPRKRRSLPVRGAWIEIRVRQHLRAMPRVAPPRVERGLKSQCKQEVCSIVVSLRACAAWVETRYTIKTGIPPNSCTAGNVKVPCAPRLLAPTATTQRGDKNSK